MRRHILSVTVGLLLAAPVGRAAPSPAADSGPQAPISSGAFNSLTFQPGPAGSGSASSSASHRANDRASRESAALAALAQARGRAAAAAGDEVPGYCVMPVIKPDPDSIPNMPTGKPDSSMAYSGRVVVPAPCPEPEPEPKPRPKPAPAPRIRR